MLFTLISSDYLNDSFYRLSFNLLIDEFIIDSEHMMLEKNGLGYSFRLSKAWDRDNFIRSKCSLFKYWFKVFRHEDDCNFVARGKPQMEIWKQWDGIWC